MKVDLKKEIASYSARRGVFEIVDVPPLRYLMIDGHGDPNTQTYADAISTLFPVAYKLKFMSKKELDRDYVVMPLEAQWWSDDMESFTSHRDKSRWDWTAMILVPDWIAEGQVERALAAAADAPALDRLRLDALTEGRCVQTLHVGPFDEEGPVLDRMHHEFIPAQGLRMTGRHHEIYLSDIRRTDPSKLRTILRQPVEGARS
ncbi:MAG TPA: GyrI-like domain-containing protein [Microbacterium sp.]|nr:GyrI-like domain-containing protein [Microbacterium sp.]